MFCATCGATVPEGGAFCQNCSASVGAPGQGKGLAGAGEAPTSPTGGAPDVAAPVAPSPGQPAPGSPGEVYCRNCGSAIKQASQFCPNCGSAVELARQTAQYGVTAAGATIPPVLPGTPDRAELRRQGRRFTAYPVWLMATLSLITLGIFTLFWLNHWHGVLPKRRADDWSTARAIWCLFIPIYAIYWVFESLLRLCTRLDEELAEAGLAKGVPKELVRWYCITDFIPYVNLLVAPILATIATAILQSEVNRLAAFDSQSMTRTIPSA